MVLRHRLTPLSWLAALGGALLSANCGPHAEASRTRQDSVAALGAQVMPFDLGKTEHAFESLPDGGLQRVTVKDPADAAQVALIRSHLQTEAARFTRGDFESPETIHGHAMPGLAELRAGAARVRVEYSPSEGGGQIRYSSADPALVEALHRWFAAQRMDHGSSD